MYYPNQSTCVSLQQDSATDHLFCYAPQILWTFSIFLESVAIMPQLFMISKTGEAESITTHYLFFLGLYRALYIANWVWRYNTEGVFDQIAVVSGVVQTIFYCDFFYLYITKGRCRPTRRREGGIGVGLNRALLPQTFSQQLPPLKKSADICGVRGCCNKPIFFSLFFFFFFWHNSGQASAATARLYNLAQKTAMNHKKNGTKDIMLYKSPQNLFWLHDF